MFSFTIADRDFPLRLIAGLNERAGEDTHSITTVCPCSMSTGRRACMRSAQLIDRRSCGSRVVRGRSSDPNEPAGFSSGIPHLHCQPGNTATCAVTDTLTSTIGEAAKWTIEKSGTVSPLFKAGVLP
jgi:hypothetical protein